MRADGRTDSSKLIVAFRNFTNALKSGAIMPRFGERGGRRNTRVHISRNFVSFESEMYVAWPIVEQFAY